MGNHCGCTQTCSCITDYFILNCVKLKYSTRPFSKWYRLVVVNCKFVVSKLPASQLFNHFKHNQSRLTRIFTPCLIPIPAIFFCLTMFNLLYYNSRGHKLLKIKVLTGLHSSWRLSENPFPYLSVSRGYLHSFGFMTTLPPLSRSGGSIFKALWSPWLLLQGTLVIPLGVPAIHCFSSLKILTLKFLVFVQFLKVTFP